jgi:hypothetical protein
MKLTRRTAFFAALAAPALARAQDKDTTMLKDLARRAAIHLFPYYEMYRTRWNALVREDIRFRQKSNRFLHVPVLATHASRAVTTPNNDTLYSSAWLDLSAEPVMLSVPDMGERYYSFAFMSMATDNFAYVCRRLDGGRPRRRMIVDPDWRGDLRGDAVVVRAPTNSVWLLGRILVDGPDDLAAVRALQAKTSLARKSPAPEAPARWPALDPSDPFDLFQVGMRVLSESPLGERDRAAMASFAPLKLSPGHKFDAASFTADEREAIEFGIGQGRAEIRAAGGRYGKVANGWQYPERHLGNFGNDHLYRAHVALAGLAALETAEATYLTCGSDETRQPLDGRNRYVLRFDANGLPPARAFWSLSMYEVTPEGRAFFTDNPLNRYAVGDRTKDLKRGADGSLEIYLQHERPAPEREANWLPAPAGTMRLVLRAYEPDETLLNGTYRVPAVKRLG